MFRLQRHHVSAGTFIISEHQPMILEAYLSSCVGIALYDPQQEVGGLLHVLLPEPPSKERVEDELKYASTALPVFLRALAQAGASRQDLQACVAGGALVRPLAEMDLSLNIGGRTEAAVRQFLSDEGIPVNKAETSGYFTCRLSLDTQQWETTIDPTGFDDPPAEALAQQPTARDIQAAIDALQPIPQMALEILNIMESETYDIQEIADRVRQDQVIAARTLQLCNSSLYNRGRRIESVDHALVMLGRNLFAKLVISALIEDFFSHCIMGYSLCKGGLFSHSLGTALAAERIAQLTGHVAPSVAYSAGLLHDIGKVVLDQFVASALPLFYRRLQQQNDFLALEQEIFGTDHAQVGLELARRWSFPASLTDVIAFHHQLEAPTDSALLVILIHLADNLMSSFHAGLKLGGQHSTRLGWCLGKLGIALSDFPRIVDLVPTQFWGV